VAQNQNSIQQLLQARIQELQSFREQRAQMTAISPSLQELQKKEGTYYYGHSQRAQMLVVESRSESYGKTNKQTKRERKKKEEDCSCALQNNKPKKKGKRHFFNSIIIIIIIIIILLKPPTPTPHPKWLLKAHQ